MSFRNLGVLAINIEVSSVCMKFNAIFCIYEYILKYIYGLFFIWISKILGGGRGDNIENKNDEK